MSEMDEQQRNPQDAAGTAQEPAGVMLRRERERQGLSLDDVALQLNLRPVVVEGLEEERFDQVPIAAYRRGYVRAYARLLGMDDAAVVRAFDAMHGRADIDRKLATVNTTQRPSRAGAWVFRLFTLLVIVGLISLTLLWWQSREGNDALGGGDDPISVDGRDGVNATQSFEANTDTALPPVPTEQDTPAGDETASSAINSNGVAADAETRTPDLDTRQAERIADAAVTPATGSIGSDSPDSESAGNESAEAAGTSAETDGNTLSLTFDGESWTQVVDATGSTVFSSLQPAGSEATVTGEPPFRMTIGESAGVTLRYRGEEIDLDQYTSGNVARFTLGD